MRFRDWHTRITAAIANAEPERDRLFNRPAPRISPELARLLARIERTTQQRELHSAGAARQSKGIFT